MPYSHDIFISYVRDEETYAWLDDHFLPLLRLRVRQELGYKPDVYVDTRLEAGVSWPQQLGHELGGSRILVALWAGDYFASRWCWEEMALMLAREEACGLRTDENPRGSSWKEARLYGFFCAARPPSLAGDASPPALRTGAAPQGPPLSG